MPARKTKTAPMPVPKRKAAPPPLLPERRSNEAQAERRPVPPPPLPKRRQAKAEEDQGDGDGMLVVAAPADSEPTTPLSAGSPSSYVQPWAEDAEGDDGAIDTPSLGEQERTAGTEFADSEPVLHDPPSPSEERIDDELGEGDDEGEDEGFAAWTESMEDTAPKPGIAASEKITP